MVTTLAAYNLFQMTTQRSNAASDSTASVSSAVEAEVEYWRENINTISSVEEFVEDERLLEFALTAYGYTEDDAPDASVILSAMTAGLVDETSYANTTMDYRLEEMVRHFAFAEFGLYSTRDTTFIEAVADRYIEAVEGDSRTSSSRSRLTAAEEEEEYFRTRIGSVETAEDLTADYKLFKYVMSAYGLEDYTSNSYFIEKALTEGTDDDSDAANLMGNEALIEMVEDFGFANEEGPNTTNSLFAEGLVRQHKIENGIAQTTVNEDETDESAYFRENIGNVTSVDDLLNDYRLYSYVMTAFDLGDEISYKGFARRALEDGVADDDDFAKNYSDTRYADMARSLAFAEYGLKNINDPQIINSIVEKYETVQAEADATSDNEAVALAAYFERKAVSFNSWYTVIGDDKTRQVAFTALGIPEEIYVQGLATVVDILESKYSFEDLKDPDGLKDFITRFTIAYDVENETATNNGLSLLFNQSSADPFSNLYNIIAQL